MSFLWKIKSNEIYQLKVDFSIKLFENSDILQAFIFATYVANFKSSIK